MQELRPPIQALRGDIPNKSGPRVPIRETNNFPLPLLALRNCSALINVHPIKIHRLGHDSQILLGILRQGLSKRLLGLRSHPPQHHRITPEGVAENVIIGTPIAPFSGCFDISRRIRRRIKHHPHRSPADRAPLGTSRPQGLHTQPMRQLHVPDNLELFGDGQLVTGGMLTGSMP